MGTEYWRKILYGCTVLLQQLIRGTEDVMQQDDDFNRMFQAIKPSSRSYVMAILRAEYERDTKSVRPRLLLIEGGKGSANLANDRVNALPAGGVR